MFAESLKSNECVEILMNCLKNLEKEVKELKDLASSNNANQIKGERQLLDLKEAVDFISNKFDNFERDRLEKEVIKDLKEEVTSLRGKVDDITAETDRQAQYSRRNSLLIHGLPESKNENRDLLAKEAIETKMNIKITDNDIDRTHRIGKPKNKGKLRPVIIKFVRYNDRKKDFF